MLPAVYFWDSGASVYISKGKAKMSVFRTLYRPFSKWTVVFDENFPNAAVALLQVLARSFHWLHATEWISTHMSYLGVNSKRGQRSTTLITENSWECNYSESRGINRGREREDMTTCPKHRRELTVDWSGRKNNSCTYPLHKTEGKAKSLKMPRRVNAIFLKFIIHLCPLVQV